MPLYKLPNFGLGHLRAKLAERKTARAAKKAGNLRRKRGSAGPKNVLSPLSPLMLEIFEEKKVDSSGQPSSLPRTTMEMTTPVSNKAMFTRTFASQVMTFVITPRSNEAAVHLGLLQNSPIRSETIQIGMTTLEQPWFARRRSSLMRLSASNMQMSDNVRSLRRPASRTHEYVPLVLDDIPVTSDGIEMELDEFSPGFKRDSLEASFGNLVDADDNASILTFEQVSFLTIHRADPLRFAPSMGSLSRDLLLPVADTRVLTSADSNTKSNDKEIDKEIPTPGRPSRCKLRPPPLPLSKSATKSRSESEPDYEYESARLTQPLPVQDHFCIISDSPLSFRSFDMTGSWSGTPTPTPADGRRTIVFWTGTGDGSARSSVSVSMDLGRSRPGTAGSERSEYRSIWW